MRIYKLIGLNPTSEKGKEFQLSLYRWVPLWDHITDYNNLLLGDDGLTEEDVKMGFRNEGWEVTAEKANAIAEMLSELRMSEDDNWFEQDEQVEEASFSISPDVEGDKIKEFIENNMTLEEAEGISEEIVMSLYVGSADPKKTKSTPSTKVDFAAGTMTVPYRPKCFFDQGDLSKFIEFCGASGGFRIF